MQILSHHYKQQKITSNIMVLLDFLNEFYLGASLPLTRFCSNYVGLWQKMSLAVELIGKIGVWLNQHSLPTSWLFEILKQVNMSNGHLNFVLGGMYITCRSSRFVIGLSQLTLTGAISIAFQLWLDPFVSTFAVLEYLSYKTIIFYVSLPHPCHAILKRSGRDNCYYYIWIYCWSFIV